jgi:DNA-binding helix-hairpin-helix protein with protein kinase domain
MGKYMPLEMSLTRYVRCETCGNHYQSGIERCPRCQSNQNASVPANDGKFTAGAWPADVDKSLNRASAPQDSHTSA